MRSVFCVVILSIPTNNSHKSFVTPQVEGFNNETHSSTRVPDAREDCSFLSSLAENMQGRRCWRRRRTPYDVDHEWQKPLLGGLAVTIKARMTMPMDSLFVERVVEG